MGSKASLFREDIDGGSQRPQNYSIASRTEWIPFGHSIRGILLPEVA
jgi:hypothetical protein